MKIHFRTRDEARAFKRDNKSPLRIKRLNHLFNGKFRWALVQR